MKGNRKMVSNASFLLFWLANGVKEIFASNPLQANDHTQHQSSTIRRRMPDDFTAVEVPPPEHNGPSDC